MRGSLDSKIKMVFFLYEHCLFHKYETLCSDFVHKVRDKRGTKKSGYMFCFVYVAAFPFSFMFTVLHVLMNA